MEELSPKDTAEVTLSTAEGAESEKSGKLASLKSRFGRLFHHRHATSTHSVAQDNHRHDRIHSRYPTSSSRSGSSVNSEDEDENDNARPSTPLVDPSTNMDPLRVEAASEDEMNPKLSKEALALENARKKKKRARDVSKHTFFVENSQMRLKLYARNTVSPGYYFPLLHVCMPIVLYSVRCNNGSQPSKGLLPLRTGHARTDLTALLLSVSTSPPSGLLMG